MAEALAARGLWKEDPAGIVHPWRGAVSAGVPPTTHLRAPPDSQGPFRGMDLVKMMRRRFEALSPAAAPATARPSSWA